MIPRGVIRTIFVWSYLKRWLETLSVREIPCECRGWAGNLRWLMLAARDPKAHHPRCRQRRGGN